MSEAARISVDEMRQMKAEGRPFVLVDVRGQSDYVQEHIPGAISLPRSELAARHGELAAAASLVVY